MGVGRHVVQAGPRVHDRCSGRRRIAVCKAAAPVLDEVVVDDLIRRPAWLGLGRAARRRVSPRRLKWKVVSSSIVIGRSAGRPAIGPTSTKLPAERPDRQRRLKLRRGSPARDHQHVAFELEASVRSRTSTPSSAARPQAQRVTASGSATPSSQHATAPRTSSVRRPATRDASTSSTGTPSACCSSAMSIVANTVRRFRRETEQRFDRRAGLTARAQLEHLAQ